MNTVARRRPDGDLPAALQHFDDALDDLTQPQTQIINHTTVHAPSYYMQLADSVRGEQGNGHGVPRSMPLLWCDAFDLLNEIDTAVSAWQPQPAGIPPTIGRLNALRQRGWRPQDTHAVTQIVAAIENWVERIEALLDPEHVKHIDAKCPACNTKTVYRNDSTGERVRQPALQIVTELGCTCQACGASWGPQLYMHLCRLLGFPLPAGVLE
jgi:hypothetical protein